MTTDEIIESMRMPNKVNSNKQPDVVKTSKRALNKNAIKFKLKNLKNSNIRYEVIYKNLIRDFRKYYSTDFNSLRYKRKRGAAQQTFLEVLVSYVRNNLSKEQKHFKINELELVFYLGSLVNPKQMLMMVKE